MYNNLKVKKACIVLLLSIPLAGFVVKKNSRHYILNNSRESIYEPYGYMGNTPIYIGDFDDKCEISSSEGIVIKDHRNSNDPNVIIMDSYKIKNCNDRIEILKMLLEYNTKYPSLWDRSLSSMEFEWFVHNLCYDFNYETNKTKDVDLNNDDENVIKFFKNNF